jgi:hypothetical protein
MDIHERGSPCTADALSGIRNITMNGKPVAPIQRCDSFAKVQMWGLTCGEEINTVLIECVSCHIYIPRAVRAQNTDALPSEYYATECR